MPRKRRVCFVTGTRAEFGLMRSTLAALRDDPSIELQLIVTGTHTHASRGRTADEIAAGGWRIDATLPWPERPDGLGIAEEMGRAMAALAGEFRRLSPDVVLVVGDRVEAFAAASAAHVGGAIVAHVHGGDRALGQVDDSLRHATSKLAHVHLAATRASGARLLAMGEDPWRIKVVGAPGIDGIRRDASRRSDVLRAAGVGEAFALFVLHPTDDDDDAERTRAGRLLRAASRHFGGPIVALAPNGDPGSGGIESALRRPPRAGRVTLHRHVPRGLFLGLMRDCRLMIGNSSAGVIEAGAFGTPVVDVGPRQAGRERGPNVRHADWDAATVCRELAGALRQRRTSASTHPYGGGGASKKIAAALASLTIDARLRRKLIRY